MSRRLVSQVNDDGWVRAGASQTFTGADGCGGRTKPLDRGSGCVTIRDDPKCVSRNAVFLGSQMAARAANGGDGLIQTSSLAQLVLVSCRWPPPLETSWSLTTDCGDLDEELQHRRRGQKQLLIQDTECRRLIDFFWFKLDQKLYFWLSNHGNHWSMRKGRFHTKEAILPNPCGSEVNRKETHAGLRSLPNLLNQEITQVKTARRSEGP